jgi:hypothetical protein
MYVMIIYRPFIHKVTFGRGHDVQQSYYRIGSKLGKQKGDLTYNVAIQF